MSGRKRGALGLLTFSCTVSVMLLGCKPTEELEACNVARPDCQQSIYYALLRMRGDGYDPFLGVPPIRTLTVEEYEAELRGPMQPPPPPPTTTDDDEPMEPEPEPEEPPIDPWDVALRLLHLVKPSTSTGEARVQDRVNHVAAFYSSRTRTVTVIDRGGIHNDRADTLLLLHELVHAVQDDEIAGWDGSSTDADFAARAMVEGEATLYENLGSLELDGLSVQDADWDSYYGNWVGRRRNAMRSNQSPYYAIGWFVYPLGGELLTQAYMRGGNAEVRHLQGNWPARAVAFMAAHSDSETPGDGALECATERPGKDFRVVDRDHFGALQVYGMLTVNGIAEEHAWDHALRVEDDELTVFFDGEAREVGVRWRVRLDTPLSASEMAIQLLGSRGLQARARGRDVVIRAGSPDEVLERWPDDEGCAGASP